jgi:pyridoxal phosphate enzyme (YggS family)
MAQVAENLAWIEAQIVGACRKSGRDRSSVRVIAVTKTQVKERILEAAAAGLKIFAESRVQEAKTKLPELAGLGAWHLIGHLQTNKAKSAVELFSCVQSVDSMHLAEELGAAAVKRGHNLDFFAEVNISGEVQKHGLPLVGAYDAVQRMAQIPGLSLRGLMAMAPASDDPEAARPVFAGLRALAQRLQPERGALELSMGMSGDFVVAVEEGATLLRLGSALFR